jgi:carboxypeptidase Taq
MDRRQDAQWAELRGRLQEVNDLSASGDVLEWDQATLMPLGGAAARARQLALVKRLAHEKFIDPMLGRLLGQVEQDTADLPYDSDDAALLRLTRRLYDRAVRVPAAFMAEIAEHSAASYNAWARARPQNDFATMRPFLEKTVALSRRYADFFPGYAHIADPLIEASDYGMTVATIRPLFAELRQHLAQLVQQISAQPLADDSCLHQQYPEAQQFAFGDAVIKAYGYDFDRGRQDRSPHPFMTKFSIGDVRITTRVREDNLSDALFSTLHEAGHALYEQGIDPALEGGPLANGASAAVHESQSRLWENIVGRSWPFWNHYYPQLQALFPNQLDRVSLEAFHRAINKVQPSLIRVDADEVTYNLHVIIRFEMELALLEGRLTVQELPEAWRAAYAESLGVTPPDDRDGVLQDVHWYAGLVGGQFQGYTLGNILSAQFYSAALRAHPEIPAEIGGGKFTTLHTWLRQNIYRHGAKFTTAELVERVTGGPLALEPYLGYLRSKYGSLYQLSDN